MSFRVLTDPSLFQRISTFQGGIPVALRQFWLDHDPKPSRGPIGRDDVTELIKLVARQGEPHHLELVKRSRFYENDQWSAPRFRRLDRLAAEYNRADILEWMLVKGMALSKPNAVWQAAIRSARSKDDFALLELLERVCPLTETNALRLIANALYKPTVPLLRWITSRYPTIEFGAALVAVAAIDQDLPVLNFLLDHPYTQRVDVQVFMDAHRYGRYDVLELLVAKLPVYSGFATTLLLDPAATSQEIVNRYPLTFVSARQDAFVDSVRAGRLYTMQTLFAVDTTKPISIDDAASWVGLAGLEFLHERGLAEATTEAMDNAAEKNRWDVVEFLHVNRTEGCTTRAADAAVKSGDMGRVRFFLEKRHEGCSTAAMDWAAEQGSMEMVRYLHEHSKAGCTPRAMDVAAARGRLRIVQFLHENRSEGCTTAAIDNAAQAGHLKMVKFLCEHRKEGCTSNAVRWALKNHHFDIVHVLYEHYPHMFGIDILFYVLLRGAFDIFTKLRDQFPEEAGSVVERVMFEAGKLLELRTVRFILDELGRSDLRHVALEGAASYESGDSAQWQEAREAIMMHSEKKVTLR